MSPDVESVDGDISSPRVWHLMSATEAITSAISESGPLRFDAYVELALYDPSGGFFASGSGAGRAGGDFLTAAEVGPLFAELVAEALCRSMPEPIVYELGAGSGELARGVLREMAQRDVECTYTVVERSAALLDQAPEGVLQLSRLPAGELSGVVIANELLDNLPFRVLRRVAPAGVTIVAEADLSTSQVAVQLEELFVGSDEDGGFDEEWRTVGVADTQLALVEIPGVSDFAPLQSFPWAREARLLIEDLMSRCDRLLFLDYGATTQELVERGIQGWMRTFAGHESGVSPLVDPGSQDITIDVPFDQLPEPTRSASQADFLRELGINDLVAEGKQIWTEQAASPGLEALKARSRIAESEALLDPEGMGSFQVLEYVRARRPAG